MTGDSTGSEQDGGAGTGLEATRTMKGRVFTAGSLVMDDRFRILELLGRGGMGEVYLAEQVSLGRKVAIKALREDLSAQAGMTERFRREALLLSTVDHPSVVRVIDFAEWQGAYLLVMEYVEGTTLGQALRSGPFSVERALPLWRQIAEGLEAIHARGIIHRDLKLDNVLLSQGPKGEQARLLDFGIARFAEGGGEGQSASVTQAGLVVGTPEYISPEQALGQSADARSDVYCFGVLAFRMLTGKLPFPGPSPREFLMQHAGTPAPRLEETEPVLIARLDVCQLVQRCLEKEPSARPADGAALVGELSAIGGEAGARAMATPVPAAAPLSSATPALPTAPPAASRSPAGLPRSAAFARWSALAPSARRALLVGGALLVVVAGGLLWQLGGDPSVSRARALLEESRAAEALVALEKSAGPQGTVLQLRAAALHRQGRHREEWGLFQGLAADKLGRVEAMTLTGLCEDYLGDESDATLKKALGRYKEGALGALVKLAGTGHSEAQWGALRYLDASRASGVELVPLYARALEAEDCVVVATAARRLGDLQDKRAVEPLEQLLTRPRPEGFLVFQGSCGHDEAESALRKLKRSKESEGL